MSAISVMTLGTGTPRPNPRRHGSCVLINIDGERLLFDVGRGAVMQLAKAQVPWATLTRLFITHHHIDHIGDLPDLLVSSWLNGRVTPMAIYGPPPTRAIVDLYRHQIYARDIQFREEEYGHAGQPEMATFPAAVVTEVVSGVVASGNGWTVRTFEVEHGHKQFGAVFRRQWICLGYRIEIGDKVVAISGDTVPCDGLYSLAANADLLLQCCWMPSSDLNTDYLRTVARHTLGCADVAGKVAAKASVKRLVLTHTRAVTQASIDAMIAEVQQDYAGPVSVAEDMDVFSV